MKVLFVSRPDNFSQPGGDSLHVEQTARQLKRLGVEVTIWRGENLTASDFDLIHFFNLTRPTAIMPLLKAKHPPHIRASI